MALRAIVVGCAVAIGCSAWALNPEENTEAQRVAQDASRLVHAYHDSGLFSGTVLIAQGDEVVYAEGIGPADRSDGRVNEVDTVFKIGSIGKQFFSAVAVRMAERGELDLHAPISTYLPDYPRPQGGDITLHMLMNQTSGIPNYTRLPMYYASMDEAVDPAVFAAGFTGLDLDFEPGSGWSYSNSGYYVLGLIIEKVSGSTLA